jgi:hypothetical protein
LGCFSPIRKFKCHESRKTKALRSAVRVSYGVSWYTPKALRPLVPLPVLRQDHCELHRTLVHLYLFVLMTNLMPDIASTASAASARRAQEAPTVRGNARLFRITYGAHWRRSATEDGAEGGVPFGCGDYLNPLGRYLSLMLARIMHPNWSVGIEIRRR